MRDLKVTLGVKLMLEGLVGEKWSEDPHLKETPFRVAKAFLDELCGGLSMPEPKIQTFPHDGPAEMILLRDIPVKSLCAHHLLPFVGLATVGYVPAKNQLVGISKLSRVVDYFARRPQVQERLTSQIADFLANIVMDETNDKEPGGVGVVVRANHFCMVLRGVNHSGDLVTSALRGVFLSPTVRAEFLQLAEPKKEGV